MAPRPRDNTIEIELAISLPCDEWFDLYSLQLTRSLDHSRRMIVGFNCVQRMRKSNRGFYFISSEAKELLICHLKKDKNNRGLDVPPVKPNNIPLELAKMLPVNEWFNIHDVNHGINGLYAKRIVKRFKCLKTKFKGGVIHYYLNADDKIKLIQCITDNPTQKEFDITVLNVDVGSMWDKLLGTNQGVKHETN